MGRFPSRMFRWAAIYGVIVLTPLYLVPLPRVGAETFLGFIGLALVFQGVFWTIGGDPVKFRTLMPYAIAEKFVFALPAITLFFIGVTPPTIALFAAIDVMLGIGFMIAWQRTPVGA